jgi:hypothetical protein
MGALHGCATKGPLHAIEPRHTASATVAAPVKLAVLPSDPLLFADVAGALDQQLARTHLSGMGPTVRAKVSMEVAQLTLECVSPTDECYTRVGRYLEVDRLLWGQIARDPRSTGVRVTIVLLDVGRGAPLGRAEEIFARNEAAIGGLRKLVDQATGTRDASTPARISQSERAP